MPKRWSSPYPALPSHGCWQAGGAARTDELETYDDSTVRRYICMRWAGEAADCDAPWASFSEARCDPNLPFPTLPYPGRGPARETQRDTVRRTMVRQRRRLWAASNQARAADPPLHAGTCKHFTGLPFGCVRQPQLVYTMAVCQSLGGWLLRPTKEVDTANPLGWTS